MAIAILQRTLSRTFLTLGLISLVACGGGGGGGTKEPDPDTIPNAYSYTATTNAELSAVITSAPVTISGINTATQVSITGGEYSVNGGAFTSVAGTVTNGQSITIRLTAPAANSTSASAQLNVGSVVGTFTVTTKPDSTPDAFSFTAQTNAALNTEYTSSAITVAGIDTAVPVSITGGEYSINGGAFTSAAGTASVNNTVRVKATSSDDNDATQAVVVTIGGVSATYSITTIPDTTPPIAEFKFPTPYTMSEAMTVKVRGTATDNNTITNVKVVVRSFNLATPNTTISSTEIAVTPKAEGDYSSWTVDVPLTALAENEVKVIATDDRNNAISVSDANKVVIRQADVLSAFPDEVNQFDYSQTSMLDVQNNRILVSESSRILAVDKATGQRSLFIEHESVCRNSLYSLTIDRQTSRLYGVCGGEEIIEFNLADGSFISKYTIAPNPNRNSFPGLALDKVNGRNRLVLVEQVYEYEEGGGQIVGFSLESKEFSVISEASELPLIQGSFGGIAVNGDNYWVTSGGQHEDVGLRKVIKVNAVTGKREVFSDNTTGTGELFSALLADGINTAALVEVVKDVKNNRLMVMESNSGKLIAIDLSTAERSLFRDLSYIGTTAIGISSRGLSLDETNEFLQVADWVRNAVILVDLNTSEKVILAKSKNSD